MPSMSILFVHVLVVFVIDKIEKSVQSCSDNNRNDDEPLLSISFGSDSQNYSDETPAHFNFTTTYNQSFGSIIADGMFDFVNVIPYHFDAWHDEALDHTENDTGGYMFLINIANDREEILNMTMDNLCIGSHYLFSAYMANIVRKSLHLHKPSVRFEVWSTTTPNQLLAQSSTCGISDYDSMTWLKYCLSFIAPNRSIVLLIISDAGEGGGNDLVIDDIELHACSTGFSGLCSSESFGLCSNNDFNGKPLFLITFESGSDEYSNKTPASFNFITTLDQIYAPPMSDGHFGFVNKVPNPYKTWHEGAWDHTENDGADGYMYFVSINQKESEIFKITINDLCIGQNYQFSAYLANAEKNQPDSIRPDVRFEVRTTTTENQLLVQFNTSSILQSDILTWWKCGISFNISYDSAVLLMISNVGETNENDLIIDDIELRVSSILQSGYCILDETSTMAPIMSTEEQTSTSQPEYCNRSAYIGPHCNISSSPCDMLKPCQNDGTCYNIHTFERGYNCSCQPDFNGTQCQFDYRPCKPYTCLPHGRCNETSNKDFHCTCDTGWQGRLCESMINFCDNHTCMNRGACQRRHLNYTCECLADSYSGRHCEIIAMRIVILRMVSKSFAYIAILAMVSVVMFVVVMDILKYCFDIDPVEEERERMRRKKRPVIQ